MLYSGHIGTRIDCPDYYDVLSLEVEAVHIKVRDKNCQFKKKPQIERFSTT
jgi:hypothetical protein